MDDVIVPIAYNWLLDKLINLRNTLKIHQRERGKMKLHCIPWCIIIKKTIHIFYRYSPMQRYKQLSPFNVRFTRTDRTCTETNELQYWIQNDTAYNTTSTIPPASLAFPVVLGDFRMWRHLSSLSGKLSKIALGSRPPLVTRIARTGLGTRLQFLIFVPLRWSSVDSRYILGWGNSFRKYSCQFLLWLSLLE